MSKESDTFRRLAREAEGKAQGCVQGKAEGHTDAFCGLMLAIGETYALLARVQDVIDDKSTTYVAVSPTMHAAT